jgi:small subunit ribosomal protein S6
MALYENVFIARQDVPTTQVETLTNQFAELVTGMGGTVSKKEYWGLRSLTYRIKKNRKGHYTLLNIDAPSAAVKEMERTMSINEDIIRFLTVRVDALEEGPSAIMLRSAEKSDRAEPHLGGVVQEAARTRPGDQARAFPGASALSHRLAGGRCHADERHPAGARAQARSDGRCGEGEAGLRPQLPAAAEEGVARHQGQHHLLRIAA